MRPQGLDTEAALCCDGGGNFANNNNHCNFIQVFVTVVLKFSLQGPDCCLFFILPGSFHSRRLIRDLFGLGRQVNLN